MYYYKYKTLKDNRWQNMTMILDVIQVDGFHIHEMTSIGKADESYDEVQREIS